MTFLNIAAYKFIELDNLPELKATLQSQLADLCGTILISPEGINLMLAGDPAHIYAFQDFLKQDPRFSDLYYKTSQSDIKPFNYLFVKIKKEIIAFGIPSINPTHQKAPYVTPQEFKKWLEDNKDMVLLDTRNDYEIAEGSFEGAQHLNIHHFRDFPIAAKNLSEDLKDKTIVTFCTGGIRCEKAALLLQQYGFKDVYQLENGILDYFNQCGSAFYQGSCYVFDNNKNISPVESSQ